MTIRDVESALRAVALGQGGIRTLALTGKWGCGKTYSWWNLLDRQEPDGAFPFERYAYVSLFGLSSLAEVKDAIWLNSVPAKGLNSFHPTRDRAARQAAQRFWSTGLDPQRAAWLRQLFGRGAKGATLSSLGSMDAVVRAMGFMDVRRCLVCLDDLERRGASLALKDVLGLISSLESEKECRVVAILNSDALEENDQGVFLELKEKVFDASIEYRPTPEECAEIAFSGLRPWHAEARRCAIKLRISNIRVLDRIRRVIEAFLSGQKKIHPDVLQQIIQSSVLLTWSYYTPDSESPSFGRLRALHPGSFMNAALGIGDPLDERTKTILCDYGYSSTDDLDVEICRYLERGFLDTSVLDALLRARHEEVVRGHLEDAFALAMARFDDSFADDESEFVNSVASTLRAAAKWVTLGSLEAAVMLLRRLDHGPLADSLIDEWITCRAEQLGPLVEAIRHDPYMYPINDAALKSRLAQAAPKNAQREPLALILRRMAISSAWGPADEQALVDATMEDLRDLVLTLDGPDTRRCVRFLLGLRPPSLPPAEQEAFSKKTASALLEIAKTSSLNATRIASYGIKLPESPLD